MAEIREQMEGQQCVGCAHHLCKPVCVSPEKLVFILLDNGVEPVAIVVQGNAEDGESSEHIAFGTGQQVLIEFYFHVSVVGYCVLSAWLLHARFVVSGYLRVALIATLSLEAGIVGALSGVGRLGFAASRSLS